MHSRSTRPSTESRVPNTSSDPLRVKPFVQHGQHLEGFPGQATVRRRPREQWRVGGSISQAGESAARPTPKRPRRAAVDKAEAEASALRWLQAIRPSRAGRQTRALQSRESSQLRLDAATRIHPESAAEPAA